MKAEAVYGSGGSRLVAEMSMIEKFNNWVNNHPHCEVVRFTSPFRFDDQSSNHQVFISSLTFFYIEVAPDGGRIYNIPYHQPVDQADSTYLDYLNKK